MCYLKVLTLEQNDDAFKFLNVIDSIKKSFFFI